MSVNDNSDDSKGKSQGATNSKELLHFPSKSTNAPVHISGLTPERTETIDLNSLFSKDVTSSGSFDLRRVGFASFGKLLQVLSTPTLLIGRSHTIEFANRAFLSLIEGLDPVGRELSWLFPDPQQARVFGVLLEKVFATNSYAGGVAILKSQESLEMLKDQTNLIMEWEFQLQERQKELELAQTQSGLKKWLQVPGQYR